MRVESNLRHAARKEISETIDVYDDDSDQFLGRLLDLSTRGLRLTGSLPIPRHRHLTLRLQPRNGQLEVLIIPAQGRWAEMAERRGQFESGVAFGEISLELRERVKALRDQLQLT